MERIEKDESIIGEWESSPTRMYLYSLRYEDLVSENSLLGKEYYEIQKEVYRNIEELENQLQVIAPELLSLLNRTLDNISDKYEYPIEKSYLQGAMDRERMLK